MSAPDLPDPADDERGIIIDAAAELLKAAMLLLDLASAMPDRFLVTMPADLSRRLMHHGYQSAFDALPDDIRAEARALALADPLVQASRAIDEEVRR